jgi:hypothetical protein
VPAALAILFARGIEAGWPRRSAARFTRARPRHACHGRDAPAISLRKSIGVPPSANDSLFVPKVAGGGKLRRLYVGCLTFVA